MNKIYKQIGKTGHYHKPDILSRYESIWVVEFDSIKIDFVVIQDKLRASLNALWDVAISPSFGAFDRIFFLQWTFILYIT